MVETRFFRRAGPFSLEELAEAAGGELAQSELHGRMILDVASLDDAGPGDITFLDNTRYADRLKHSKAGACILDPKNRGKAPPGMALLLSKKPYVIYAKIAAKFYPSEPPKPGIHPTAIVDPAALVSPLAQIGPFAVIGAGASIGDGCRIGSHCFVGPGVEIAAGSVLGAHVSLEYCQIGRDCQIHAGARVGTRGFGFAMDEKGFVDIPQVGRVIIGDRVEIGANSTIDRGTAGDTVIGSGSKIDNLVQLGHNVHIGRDCILVAQSGVAGSSRLADRVTLAAQSGVAGHLSLEEGAKVAAQSGVMRPVGAGQTVGGTPAIPLREFFRLVTYWRGQMKEKEESDD